MVLYIYVMAVTTEFRHFEHSLFHIVVCSYYLLLVSIIGFIIMNVCISFYDNPCNQNTTSHFCSTVCIHSSVANDLMYAAKHDGYIFQHKMLLCQLHLFHLCSLNDNLMAYV